MEPKPSGFRLTSLNTLIATVAGLISILGGVYSLKTTVFATKGIGDLDGIVRDEAIARPLYQATVEVSDINNLVVGTLYTDKDGRYELKKLKEGPYIVKVSAVRHVPQIKAVTVVRAQATDVNFDLAAVAVETPASVPAAEKPVTYSPAVAQAVPAPPPPPAYNPSRRTDYNTEAPFSLTSQQERASGYQQRYPQYSRRSPYAQQEQKQGSPLVQAGLTLLENYVNKKKSESGTTGTTSASQNNQN